MSRCPQGHESTWDDYCSICGERMPASANPSTSPPPSQTHEAAVTAELVAPVESTATTVDPHCDHCGESRHLDDVFCESCGYDFASGSLPDQLDGGAPTMSAAPASGPAAPSESNQAPVTTVHALVSVDRDFFGASVGDVELELPDPIPPTETVPLPGSRILIGRQSTSRGIFPEIDVRALNGDPAVSSRHAMLERNPAGAWTLTDLGSTNGTFLSADADPAVVAGQTLAIEIGAPIYLGAWTRIELTNSPG